MYFWLRLQKAVLHLYTVLKLLRSVLKLSPFGMTWSVTVKKARFPSRSVKKDGNGVSDYVGTLLR
jgi:hypothetical protein